MASVNTQFSIAVHLMAGLADRDAMVTSDALARSVNTNAVFVKRVLAKLSRASLIHARSGKSGGCTLARKASEISLLDIYRAVEAPRAFAIHDYPAVRSCKVSSNIKPVMSQVLTGTQRALEDDLSKTTLAALVERIRT